MLIKSAQLRTRRASKGYREGYDRGRNEALGELIDCGGPGPAASGCIGRGTRRYHHRGRGTDPSARWTSAISPCVASSGAIEDAAAEIWVSLRVSPEDLPLIEEGLRQLPMSPSWPEIRSVEPDPLLKAGETILETPKGRIHVGLRQQLSRLKAGLQNLEA